MATDRRTLPRSQKTGTVTRQAVREAFPALTFSHTPKGGRVVNASNSSSAAKRK